ncbi:hypothetical protein IWX47DRAFT_861036 [Phyllosticta citricarpa]|uniref:Secreted protein n=1 Tax=Phyllosticta citricarpa TaxID=55181 RepID=A0ABR1MJB3_9PEZI
MKAAERERVCVCVCLCLYRAVWQSMMRSVIAAAPCEVGYCFGMCFGGILDRDLHDVCRIEGTLRIVACARAADGNGARPRHGVEKDDACGQGQEQIPVDRQWAGFELRRARRQ